MRPNHKRRGGAIRTRVARVGVLALLWICGCAAAHAQSYGITYQGELRENGELVDGVFDFRFQFFAAAIGDDAASGVKCFDDVEVVGGRFTVLILPDSVTFLNDDERYLGLEVRPGELGSCDDSSGFEPLGSRQLVSSAPFALVSRRSEFSLETGLFGGLPATAYAQLGSSNVWTGGNTFPNATITAASIGSATLTGPLTSSSRIQVGAFNSGTPLTASSDASNPNAAFFTSFSTTGTVVTLSNNGVGGRGFAIVNSGSDDPFGAGNLRIRDVSAASDRITLTTAGNVGIGTNAPAARFDVAGTARVASVLTLAAPQGTAPMSVTSTTKVDNLNADQLDNIDSPLFARRDQANTFAGANTFTGASTFAQLSATGITSTAITSTAPQGTAPLTVASTTKVENLNADQLDSIDSALFARRDLSNAFGPGNSFSGLQVNGDLTVTQNIAANSLAAQQGIAALVPQGTAPLTVVSSTKVNNLNVDLLDGIDSPLFARRDQANSFGLGNSFAGLQVNGDLSASQGVFANSVVAQQTVAALAPQGVAPLIVASNFKVNNLNVDMLDGIDSPLFARRDQANTFGPNNSFAGLQVNGDHTVSGNLFVGAILAQQQIITLAPNGIPPFIVNSLTKVNNLNVDQLDGIDSPLFARRDQANIFGPGNSFAGLTVNGDLNATSVFANNYVLTTPVNRTLMIQAAAFQTDGQIPYFRGPHEIRGTSANTVLSLYAPIQLPQGARIREITFNAYDNTSGSLTFTLKSATFALEPADTVLVVLNSAGQSPTWTSLTHSFAPDFPVVNNSANTYYLSVAIPVPVLPALPADLRMGSVRIEYDVNSPLP